MAAFIGRHVWDILATSSGTVTIYFIYRATTKYS
jgi:predicted secreted protein